MEEFLRTWAFFPPDEEIWVEFDLEDLPTTSCTYDPLDAEMFPPQAFFPPETFLFY